MTRRVSEQRRAGAERQVADLLHENVAVWARSGGRGLSHGEAPGTRSVFGARVCAGTRERQAAARLPLLTDAVDALARVGSEDEA